jgi:transcriptional regulator GlxA family with amidase domain
VRGAAASGGEARPKTLGLLLIDGFALMSYASLVEAFRAANNLAGRELYRWVHVAVDGPSALASNGAAILADRRVGEALACDLLFVFAGGDPRRFDDPRTFAWLRQQALAGAAIGGVSGGPYVLARAGLLDGHRATIHWEHADAFREDFPLLELAAGLYVIDRRRMTCAGGIAGLDLAIELIEREHGQSLAQRVSEWFIRTAPRQAEQPQRLSLRERYGVRHDSLLKALAEMEAAVEEPRSRQALAAAAGVTVRQLERLFRAQLGATMGETYLKIRLEQAERMLRTTGLSVTAVGLACGFASASHFARTFRSAYGQAPRDWARGG